MTDHLKKVQSGDALKIPASTFNTFVDSARDYLQRRQSQSGRATPSARKSGIVLVKNNSGSDVGSFAILAEPLAAGLWRPPPGRFYRSCSEAGAETRAA